MRSIAAFVFIVGVLALTTVSAATATASPHVATPTRLVIVVGKHGVSGGLKKFTVRKGRHVVLLVRSALGKAVHLHGYDIEKPIKTRTLFVRIAFVAKLTGVFEIELHLTETRDLQIGQLTVT